MEHGYEKTSVRMISNRLNISPGALYKHFKHKEALLDDIVGPEIEKFWNYCRSGLEEFQSAGLEKMYQGESRSNLNWWIDFTKDTRDMWIFILFKSKGSKYEHFIDEIVAWEFEAAKHVFKVYSKNYEAQDTIHEIELETLLKSFIYTVALLFQEEFEQSRIEHCVRIINEMYRPTFYRIFTTCRLIERGSEEDKPLTG